MVSDGDATTGEHGGESEDESGDEEKLSLGLIGVSEGNGHPYSFSSIVNGYDDAGLADAGWDVIYDYVREKHPSELGLDGARFTHAWTQDDAETERLCAASGIPNAPDDYTDMTEAVDAVVIARDDHETHAEFARPFLDAGVPTFVDKPLSLDPDELAWMRPHLESGRLMSCSGMRYARELDTPRASIDDYGTMKLVRGTVIKDWDRYSVHMLDAIFTVVDADPVAVRAPDAPHESVAIETRDEDGGEGPLVQIDALGDAAMTFDVDLYGTERATRHPIRDNFRAFRRLLWEFLEQVRTGDPAIPPAETLTTMRVVIAGRRAMETGERVPLDAVEI
ncbi:Gfo/Idh/MocA family protein [Salinigranum sp. GCM10025319]|uniref:Gfo/Idh/MocA family protein n=1 Tax=Salinigranum sp. GCM10025319 TaxID=3252687 RepID=UPI0036132F1E